LMRIIDAPNGAPLACNVDTNCCRKLGNTVPSKVLIAAARDVRFWHKADMPMALSDVRFWG
jgi:hypothetical protein